METLSHCRDMEARCRQSAVYDPERSWQWLANAEKWKERADEAMLTAKRSCSQPHNRAEVTVLQAHSEQHQTTLEMDDDC